MGKNDQKTSEAAEATAAKSAASTVTAAPKPKATEKRRINALHIIFIGLVIAIIGFGGGWLGSRAQNTRTDNTVASTKQRVVLDNQGELISAIAEEVGQSVVSVNVTTQTTNNYWFGGTTEQQGAGTGIILTKDGLIVTNRHVVPEGTTSVKVVLSNDKEFDAEVVGRTSESDPLDVAFVKIKNLGDTTLVPAKLGESSKMKVGYSVIAIGNALGQFQNTVTMGILSGYGRNIVAGDSTSSQGENLEDMFQTDAAINQGNSGGPLVNIDGEVIGINTAVAGDGAENIGFAIPIDNIKGLIANVEKNGTLERPYLGVVYVMLTESIAKEHNLAVNEGAYVIPSSQYNGQPTIMAGSPADKAGLKEGDVITKVDDAVINKENSLASVLGKYSPGDTIKLTVNRDGQVIELDATLTAVPS